jgi:hypothetical protein
MGQPTGAAAKVIPACGGQAAQGSVRPTSWGWLLSSRRPRPRACSGSSTSPTPALTGRSERRWNAQRPQPSEGLWQRVPPPVARLAMKLLSRPNDALASILGTGVTMDQSEITWDDAPLRERGITPRSATDWINQQAGRS